MKYSSIVMAVLLSIGLRSTMQSQRVQTNGPYGDDVYTLAVSCRNLFVGTEGGAV